jgi:hypothetical protein
VSFLPGQPGQTESREALSAVEIGSSFFKAALLELPQSDGKQKRSPGNFARAGFHPGAASRAGVATHDTDTEVTAAALCDCAVLQWCEDRSAL